MSAEPSRGNSSGMRYQRLLRLGSGGMATVELALAKGPGGFHRLVVLKSMRKELPASTDGYRMFLEEARLSARLNHPNVVQVSEVLETPEGIVLVMEYLDGACLSDVYRIANQALSLPMRLRLICEVLAGLHYAHELTDFTGERLSIVHRDVSPQNVFVTYDGRIKIVDFGIAKAADSSERTQAGLVKGRLAYMPAEQLEGAPVNAGTDIYAVGCLLWEALAGRRMWADQTERDIARRVLSGDVPALSGAATVEPELEGIVRRATARDPNHRYASAEEMRLALENYLAARFPPVTARDIGDMLSTLSDKARTARRRAIADAIALIETKGDDVSEQSFVFSITHSSQRPSRLLFTSEASFDALGGDSGTRPSNSSPSSGSIAVRAGSIQESVRSHRSSGRSRRASIAVAGVVASSVVLGLSLLERAPRQPQTPTRPVAMPAEPAALAVRTLLVEVVPSDARIFIDERRAPANPWVLTVAAGSHHVVRAERAGYEPSVRELSAIDDVELRVELAARAPATQVTPATRPKTRRHRAPVASPGVSAGARLAKPTEPDNCSSPYYFANGNKTYKPECM